TPGLTSYRTVTGDTPVVGDTGAGLIGGAAAEAPTSDCRSTTGSDSSAAGRSGQGVIRSGTSGGGVSLGRTRRPRRWTTAGRREKRPASTARTANTVATARFARAT